MQLFLFTNSSQRELVSIWTQSIRNSNWLSLHLNLGPIEDRSKSKIHMWRLGSIWWLPITNQKQWKMCTARFDGKPAELSETLHFFFIFCLLTHSRYPYFYPLDGVFIKFPLMQKVNHWKNSIFLICGVIQLTNWTMKIKKLNY